MESGCVSERWETTLVGLIGALALGQHLDGLLKTAKPLPAPPIITLIYYVFGSQIQIILKLITKNFNLEKYSRCSYARSILCTKHLYPNPYSIAL